MVARGQVRWLELADEGRRPVLVLTRDEAIPVLRNVVVALVTRTIREIPTEVPLRRVDRLRRQLMEYLLQCGLHGSSMPDVRRIFEFSRTGPSDLAIAIDAAALDAADMGGSWLAVLRELIGTLGDIVGFRPPGSRSKLLPSI